SGTFGGTVVAADVTGDGRIDILVSDPLDNGNILLLRGNGDGTFGAPKVVFASFPNTTFAVADLNGDGKQDLIVSGAMFYVLLGLGNGTFQPAVSYDAGQLPDSIAVEDLNGDGKPDIAVTNNQNVGMVTVLTGNGKGSFQAARTFTISSSDF